MRLTVLLFLLVPALAFAQPADASSSSTAETDNPPPAPTPAQSPGRPISSTLDLQIELHRRGFSCGSIDGVMGLQTESALKAFQRSVGIAESGHLDEPTRSHLFLTAPALATHELTVLELGSVHPVPPTWLEKSQLTTLAYGSALELVAEHYHAHPNLLRTLNPQVNWNGLLPGATVTVPAVEHATVTGEPAQIVITLGARELEVLDDTSRVIAHFPVSIARMAEKRPVGDLHVTVIIPNPDYTFDPDVFPESAEGKTLGRKLVVPPGPNNPVGVAWIGLDRPGYGIHGTPDPEKVGRTESHGCFRLANWDVLTLVGLVRVGMTVIVDP